MYSYENSLVAGTAKNRRHEGKTLASAFAQYARSGGANYAQAVLSLVEDSVYTRVPESLPEGSGKWDEDYTQQNQEEETTSNMFKQINIFPNPFKNSFNINYILEEEAKDVRVEVYDLTGRSILQKQLGKTLSGTINLDLGECLGVYLLRIFADNKQVYREKLICIQR